LKPARPRVPRPVLHRQAFAERQCDFPSGRFSLSTGGAVPTVLGWKRSVAQVAEWDCCEPAAAAGEHFSSPIRTRVSRACLSGVEGRIRSPSGLLVPTGAQGSVRHRDIRCTDELRDGVARLIITGQEESSAGAFCRVGICSRVWPRHRGRGRSRRLLVGLKRRPDDSRPTERGRTGGVTRLRESRTGRDRYHGSQDPDAPPRVPRRVGESWVSLLRFVNSYLIWL